MPKGDEPKASGVDEGEITKGIHREVLELVNWAKGAVEASTGAVSTPAKELANLVESLSKGEAFFLRAEAMLNGQILNSIENRDWFEEFKRRPGIDQQAAAEYAEDLERQAKRDARNKTYLEILEHARGSLHTMSEQVRRIYSEQQEAGWRRIEEAEKKFQHTATRVGILISVVVTALTIVEAFRTFALI